ncbi:MAG: sulfatase-like hydrolase/transferase [Candidatus Hydrogenedentes bacterium]|nr:sulfatase-like hydrolase/transferase [Candidatus Hydrogenedentota bacterium]
MKNLRSFLQKHWKKVLAVGVKLCFITLVCLLLFNPTALGIPEDSRFQAISPTELWESLKSIDPATAAIWFTFATSIKLVGIFCGITRWRILLRAQGVHIPFWYLTKCWFWGRAIGLFMPGTLGLDGFRLVESSRYTGEIVKCTTVIAVEKLTGFITLFSLVFLTLPLGLRLFDINLALLGVVLLGLACFISVILLLLLQPRVIQVLAASIPMPEKIRIKVNKFAVAATAYSAHRGSLMLALLFGLGVHLGTCLMYFGTASAIRAENTGILEIFFASPLLIVGAVFAPTVSGIGVSEVVMTTLLGPGAGQAKALLFGHLGLWFGEIIPFTVSMPLLLLTGRPNREELLEEIAEVRARVGTGDEADLRLSPEVLARYRHNVLGALVAGPLAGLLAGASIGLFESAWLWHTLGGLGDSGLFLWSALVYGLLFAIAGLGVALGLVFVYLLIDRFPPHRWSYALAFAGTFLGGGLVIGLFRLRRDVFDGFMPDGKSLALFGLLLGGLALVGALKLLFASGFVLRRFPAQPKPVIGAGLAAYAILFLAGLLLFTVMRPNQNQAAFAPARNAQGPNIILIAVDTLRADYLKAWNPAIETETPNLDGFIADSVRFQNAFSQASWTKASFGSIFSGMYPECHTAVTKTASLPPDVETVAELLQAGGYYTQGFANNPNIAALFGYDQGFVNYVDLKKSLHFAAGPSASNLALYDVLIKVRETLNDRLLKRPIVVTDYYQPAPVVKDAALSFLESGNRPADTPFFLFTHFMDPHDPFMDPDTRKGGYGRKRLGNPDPETYLEKMRRAYIGEIEYLDAALGDFFAGLKERGLYDDALIVLTADHGEEFHEHGGWWHGQTLYDEQTHVPFIVKLPGKARAGEVNTHLARNLDLAPTFLHFAGLEKGAMMQGQSLFDAAGEFTNAAIGYSYAENNFEGIVLQAVRTTAHKVIRANEGNKRGLPAIALYDMAADTTEQTNLAGSGELAEVEALLNGTIDAYLTICEENAVDPSQVKIDAGTLESLEAIGYIGN